MNNGDGETSYGVFKMFGDILRTHSSYIMMLVSFVMVIFAFSSLGIIPGIFAMIACVLLFFGVIVNKIYAKEIPNDLTIGLTNPENKQAKRVCKKMSEQGIAGNIINNIFGQSGGGGGVSMDPEKLLKKMKKLADMLKK
jgi:hypothetical protein